MINRSCCSEKLQRSLHVAMIKAVGGVLRMSLMPRPIILPSAVP